MAKRTLAIGDIHGCLTALEALLNHVAPGPNDVVVLLGDYVDRGPDSRGVIERIMQLAEETQLYPLQGNHEVMMVGAWRDGRTDNWLEFGGKETLESYGRRKKAGTLSDVPEHHWDFLTSGCAWYHETPSHVFVHAGLEPETPLEDQAPLWLFWEKLAPEFAQPHCSGKTIVCGHTPQTSGEPLNLGHTICIDTQIYAPTGWLTCLDTQTGEYWQANQQGEVRDSNLSEPLSFEGFDDQEAEF